MLLEVSLEKPQKRMLRHKQTHTQRQELPALKNQETKTQNKQHGRHEKQEDPVWTLLTSISTSGSQHQHHNIISPDRIRRNRWNIPALLNVVVSFIPDELQCRSTKTHHVCFGVQNAPAKENTCAVLPPSGDHTDLQGSWRAMGLPPTGLFDELAEELVLKLGVSQTDLQSALGQ